MGSPEFTLVHVIISIIAIVSGLIVVGGLRLGQPYADHHRDIPCHDGSDERHGLLLPRPPCYARTDCRSPVAGAARDRGCRLLRVPPAAEFGVWLTCRSGGCEPHRNRFVLVAQSFAKVPQFHAAAPTGSEPPFAITQVVVLADVCGLGLSVSPALSSGRGLRLSARRRSATRGTGGLESRVRPCRNSLPDTLEGCFRAYMPDIRFKSRFLADFVARGAYFDCTEPMALDDAHEQGAVTAYIGFDCTAPSLHVGHALPDHDSLRRLQQAGHRPIVVLGGGTTKVGDPLSATRRVRS